MRKPITILLLVLALAGCSQSRPKNISDSHYHFGMKVLEIADSFLDYDITADVGSAKLDALTKQGGLDNVEFGHPNHLKNSQIEHHATTLLHLILNSKYGRGSYNDVLSSRNGLAKVLGKKER